MDASVWVSRFVPEDVHHRASSRWLRQFIEDGGPLVEPIVLLAEVAGAIARRTGLPELGSQAASRILAFPRLSLVAVDPQLGQAAARIAAEHRLRGADAIYVALAEQLDIALMTWDNEQIARGQSVIQVGNPSTL